MYPMLKSITQRLRLPAICILCNQYYHGAEAICHECSGLFPLIASHCQFCAYPLPDVSFSCCGYCAKEKPDYDKALIAYRYEEPLRTLIHQFKYRQTLYLGTLLAELIVKAIPPEYTRPQCLIPVPMHRKRLQQRGFNQAAVLTKIIAKSLTLPYQLNACQKIKNTQPQALLDQKMREKNLNKAFKVGKMNVQHIAIIDDLLTTGNTANQLARQFKAAGVKRVDVWCCARAVLD